MTPLADQLRGRVVYPTSPDYDRVRRVWNGAIDRRPALIALCADAGDAAAALRYARSHDLDVAVRSGGHGVAGQSVCDGAVVIDVSALKRIDIADGIARAGAGLLNGELDAATQRVGLATTSGIVTHTGFAGLTLGGGIGWLMRRYAASCDNLFGAQLVSADGERLEIGPDHELLWALRGAGANFGVVTRLDVRLHPVGPEVLAGVLAFPADRAEAVLTAYRDIVRNTPRELGTIVNLRHAPPLPWVPQPLHGRPVVLVALCWCGPFDAGERQIAALRNLRPLVDTVAPQPYVHHQALFDPAVPHGLQYHWRSEYAADLDDEVLRVLLAHAWEMSSKRSYTIVFQLGGALADLDPGSAVFAGRSGFAINVNGVWVDRGAADDDTAWVRRASTSLRAHSTGVYVNFLDDEGPSRVAAAYGASYERLVALKRRYDPDNVFRHNHNISPEGRDRRCVPMASTARSPGPQSSSVTGGPS